MSVGISLKLAVIHHLTLLKLDYNLNFISALRNIGKFASQFTSYVDALK